MNLGELRRRTTRFNSLMEAERYAFIIAGIIAGEKEETLRQLPLKTLAKAAGNLNYYGHYDAAARLFDICFQKTGEPSFRDYHNSLVLNHGVRRPYIF